MHIGITRDITISVRDNYGGKNSLPAFDLTVLQLNQTPDTNHPPSISGLPSTTVEVGGTFSFTPNATDSDSDPLTFNIINKPSWANINSSTGTLTGTPLSTDIGSTSDINISVSDGKGGIAKLPAFNLTVKEASGQLPDLVKFNFVSQGSKALPGKSTDCNGIIASNDQIGRLGLVSLFYQNACYTDGQYNHNNYKVERGYILDADSQTQIEAYRIYEPTNKAKKFLASEHVIYYQFPTQEDYTVYQLDGESISLNRAVTV